MPPTYVALQPMTVKTLDASGLPVQDAEGKDVYREVARGEEVPEAIYWPNLWVFVQQRRLTLKEQFIPDTPMAPGAPTPVAAAAETPRRSKREPSQPAAG